MRTNETRLQIICRKCAEKIARAIIEEIENGAKVKREFDGGITVGGVYVQKPCRNVQQCDGVVVLELFSEELKAALADDAEMLAKRKADLERQINEIDNQLNSMKQ